MPKHENKNGKYLSKTLKTLDYSPISRYIKSDHFACIGKTLTIGAPLLSSPVNSSDDNLGILGGFLAPATYSDNSTVIPLTAKLYYFTGASTTDTGVEVTSVDLSNVVSFVFEVDVKNDEHFDAFKYGLVSSLNGNNGNNENNGNTRNNGNNGNTIPYNPVVTLAAGPLILKKAEYLGSNDNVSCFATVYNDGTVSNYRVHVICTEDIMYFSENPETTLKNNQSDADNKSDKK